MKPSGSNAPQAPPAPQWPRAARANQTLKLRDGRRLGFAEFGPAIGKPIFYFHGMPGSRFQLPLDERVLFELGVRIISVERPGYGLSSAKKDRTLLDWASDVQELADHLGIERFRVMGYSGGGPYALAVASALPGRVEKAVSLSGLAPFLPELVKELPFSYRLAARFPVLVSLEAKARHKKLANMESVQATSREYGQRDQELLRSEACRNLFFGTMLHGVAGGFAGFDSDAALVFRPWGFDARGIEAPVDVWYGGSDAVPPAMGEFLTANIRGARRHFVPSEGHLLLTQRWRSILSEALKAAPSA